MYLNMEIKMRLRKVIHIVAIAIILAFVAGAIGQLITGGARAEGSIHGVVNEVTQNYEYVTYLDPTKVCKDMEIPIYSEGQARRSTSGNILMGIILGGVAGKVITGNDKGAAGGAVIGSLIANDNAQKPNRIIVGYKQERRCTLEHREVEKKIATDYTIQYSWNGIYGSAYTNKPYRVGDEIPITVRIDIR